VSSRAKRGIYDGVRFEQICPRRIQGRYQRILLGSAPALDLLLSGDGIFNVLIFFSIDQHVDPISAGESTALAAAVFGDPVLEIVVTPTYITLRFTLVRM
jgi:hypothetical protein